MKSTERNSGGCASANLPWWDPRFLMAFGLGGGCSPWAPGTFGTLTAVPFGAMLWLLPEWGYLLVLVVGFGGGVWLCDRVSRRMGAGEDPSAIVWDEWIGYWVALYSLPPGIGSLLLAFLLFRFFDILKPWPISWLERRYHGGLGIMLDDLLAGLFALAVARLVLHFWGMH